MLKTRYELSHVHNLGGPVLELSQCGSPDTMFLFNNIAKTCKFMQDKSSRLRCFKTRKKHAQEIKRLRGGNRADVTSSIMPSKLR
jgi:hypothetical protein